jgi:hypothetical protein
MSTTPSPAAKLGALMTVARAQAVQPAPTETATAAVRAEPAERAEPARVPAPSRRNGAGQVASN